MDNFDKPTSDRLERPFGVLIIGIVNIILSLIFILVILAFPSTQTTTVVSNGQIVSHVTRHLIPEYIVLIMMIIMVFPLLFSILFLLGYEFARILMMVGAIIEIFTIVLIPLAIIILWYLSRPNVKAYFQQPKHL